MTVSEKQQIYQDAVRLMNKALCEWEYENAAGLFASISGWCDADALEKRCHERARETKVEAIYKNALHQMKNVQSENGFLNTARLFESIADYRDASQLRAECLRLADESRLNDIYSEAMKILHRQNRTVNDCMTAKMLFEKLPGYRDADEQAKDCVVIAAETEQKLKAEAEADEKKKKAVRLRKRMIKLTGIFLLLAGIFGCGFSHLNKNVLQPERIYREAGEALRAGDTVTAYALYQTIPKYKDVASVLNENASITDYKREEVATLCHIPGSIVKIGVYQQCYLRDGGPEPLEWLVLEYDETNHKALLITLKSIDAKPFHTENVDITWAGCSLRTWLNSDFIETAFNETERDWILLTSIDNSAEQGCPGYATDSGEDTEDRIFLLSYKEVCTYFAYNEARAAERTAWALYREMLGHADRYYLRSPGNYQNMAAVVYSDGTLVGSQVSSIRGVRPAMWVDVSEIVPE